MRHEKTIDLDGVSATVRELRVRDVRRMLKEFQNLEDLDLTDLDARFDEIVPLFAGSVELSDGKQFEDLTFSEIASIADAFREVNEAALKLKAALLGAAVTG